MTQEASRGPVPWAGWLGKRPWLALGAAVPTFTLLILLFGVDEFNVRGSLQSGGRPAGVDPAVQAAAAAAAGAPASSSGEGNGDRLSQQSPTSPSSPEGIPARVRTPKLKEPCVEAAPLPSARTVREGRPPKVGLSMALHPPKFYAAATFLRQYAACPGALKAMSVFIVFTTEEDSLLFQESLACLAPEVPTDAWTPVVARTPAKGWMGSSGAGSQILCAYKKWHGVAFMMDLPQAESPDYGLIVDSELLLFDNAGGELRGGGCAADGPWAAFHARLQAKEASRSFPAARVSSTLTTYTFGNGLVRSGRDYDKALINENARFLISGRDLKTCKTAGCQEVKRTIDEVLFSWWTDVPWVRLDVAKRMFAGVAGSAAKEDGFRGLSTVLNFPRFEHIAYQMWCMLHEGFSIRDVTNMTGEAKWASYMEDPQPNARLGELQPLWISSEALERVESDQLPPLQEAQPPLIIFHADKGRPRANREQNRERWRNALVELLEQHGRTDVPIGDL